MCAASSDSADLWLQRTRLHGAPADMGLSWQWLPRCIASAGWTCLPADRRQVLCREIKDRMKKAKTAKAKTTAAPTGGKGKAVQKR